MSSTEHRQRYGVLPHEIEPGRSVLHHWTERNLTETWEDRKKRRAAERAASPAQPSPERGL